MELLFLECIHIWSFFTQLFDLHLYPPFVLNIWTSWLPSLNSNQRMLWDLFSRAIISNIWLERNIGIFQSLTLPFHNVLFNITNMLLSWFFTALDPQQQTLKEASHMIKRSLDFIKA